LLETTVTIWVNVKVKLFPPKSFTVKTFYLPHCWTIFTLGTMVSPYNRVVLQVLVFNSSAKVICCWKISLYMKFGTMLVGLYNYWMFVGLVTKLKI